MIDVGELLRVELSHVVGYADGEAHLDMPEIGIVLMDIISQSGQQIFSFNFSSRPILLKLCYKSGN